MTEMSPYEKLACSPSHFKDLKRVDSRKIYNEGKKAFYAGVSPDHSPYLNRDGDNRMALPDWMLGWSAGYREYATSGFTPAWSDGEGRVLGNK